MKLRIKYSNTQKFILNIDPPTLENLKQSVSSYVSSTYGSEIKHLDLSFNGKEPIEGEDDASLADLGIVNSDLLFVIQSASPPRLSSGENRASSSSLVVKASQESVVNKDTINRKENICLSHRMVSNLLEAVDGRPPKSVFDHFEQYSPSSENEVLNLLIHITMLESGFVLGETPSNSSKRLPSCWKEMVATLKYHNPGFCNFVCTIVIVTMGNIKQVLASFENQESEISVKLETKEYFASKEILPHRLVKLSNLSRELRNNLLYPMQVAAHLTLNLPAPWHLAGLPREILVDMISLLDLQSVLRIRITCKALHNITEDNKLWYNLFKRDFKEQYHSSDTISGADWKAKYKAAYDREKEKKRKEAARTPFVIDPIPNPLFNPPPLNPFPGGRDPFNPYMPQPRGPHPYYPPEPDPQPNPFWDPDSPYFGDEIPPPPGPFLPGPFNPLCGIRPNRPNPLQPPFMPPQPRNPRGPRFDFI